MTSIQDTLRIHCPEVDGAFLREHVSRLPHGYFRRFSVRELCGHLKALARLTPPVPVETIIRKGKDHTVHITVLAFDYLSVFSLITGILSGLGFHIVSGEVFTYRRAVESSSGGEEGRRRIIDHFTGTVDSSLSFRAWKEDLIPRIRDVVRLLEAGGEEDRKEARRLVSQVVVRRLSLVHRETPPPLPPVELKWRPAGEGTHLKIVSEDTPFFLHALSQALSIHRVSIEEVRIRTIAGRIEDDLLLVDRSGKPVEDRDTRDRIRWSVLLTKQFAYALPSAPDPLAALDRFDSLLDEIVRLPGKAAWLDMLADPHMLKDLARLLGASDFLWEDVVRLQYETLIPMLRSRLGNRRFSGPEETVEFRLLQFMEEASDDEEAVTRLNTFKDREIFRIDLDHILDPAVDFRDLSRRLTRLGEAVLRAASRMAYDGLKMRFGRPLSVAGMETPYALMGLGKLGGAALGYASDIEILLVYADSGKTSGERSIANADFFARLVKDITRMIRAKREGIFHVDVRLRPYGSSGPLACSLESFCGYYGPQGQAHAAERLALVRMRAVAGDPLLGGRLERLRDEMIYASRSIDPGQLREARARQFREKIEGKAQNAKFSPGALVDLEYGIQVLQVLWGRTHPRLATPLLHEAVDALAEAGVLSAAEAEGVQAAYDFLRRLINAMRMLRGSAQDLRLPEPESGEFAHLARRMGYGAGGGLEPAQQLRLDYETHTAVVRAFVERHFGRDALPGPDIATVADLVLSEEVPEGLRRRILEEAGFRVPDRAYVNLTSMAGKGFSRETFARLSVLACDMLRRGPDPDMALNNWERYVHVLSSPEMHYQISLAQPMRLEILLGLFGGSQFLADTLIRTPGFLDWVLLPEVLHVSRRRKDIEEELSQGEARDRTAWMNRLRRLRRREFLRIGTRDICLGVPVEEIIEELSVVAEACIQATLDRTWERLRRTASSIRWDDRERFCILALGKLGGGELNYSSDIDLLGVIDPSPSSGSSADKEMGARIMEEVRADLSSHSEEGYAYRVDLRLRPFGRSGDLVPTARSLVEYYRTRASLWEIQAAIKMRPVAGNLQLGYRVVEAIRSVLVVPRKPEDIAASCRRMRDEAEQNLRKDHADGADVKDGPGGIRDVEFFVQALQMIHAARVPEILDGNTLRALVMLEEMGILSPGLVADLREDYLFLRRVEHALQLAEDRQTHRVPEDPDAGAVLARRVARSGSGSAGSFGEELRQRMARVSEAVNPLFRGPGAMGEYKNVGLEAFLATKT